MNEAWMPARQMNNRDTRQNRGSAINAQRGRMGNRKYVMRAICWGLLFSCLLLAGCESTMTVSSGEAAFYAGEPLVSEQAVHSPWIATKNMTRINSDDHVKAAVTISRTVWPGHIDEQRPNGVVLVPDEQWATAMAAADLIHFPNNGPLLYIKTDRLPEETRAELLRLKPKGTPDNKGVQVIVVGKVDGAVINEVKKLGLKMDVIAGDKPAEVAAAIDDYYARVSKERPMSVIIASSDEPAYALPAVNWIAHMQEPVLYVNKQGIPQATADALAKRRKKAVMYILGSENIIPREVTDELAVFGRVERIAAATPVEQAIAFAKYKDKKTGFGWGITTPGHHFSFVKEGNERLAIAQAPFAHLGKHAPLLWVQGDQVPMAVYDYVQSIRPYYGHSPVEGPYNAAWLTGAEMSVVPRIQSELDALLEIQAKSGAGHGSTHHHSS